MLGCSISICSSGSMSGTGRDPLSVPTNKQTGSHVTVQLQHHAVFWNNNICHYHHKNIWQLSWTDWMSLSSGRLTMTHPPSSSSVSCSEIPSSDASSLPTFPIRWERNFPIIFGSFGGICERWSRSCAWIQSGLTVSVDKLKTCPKVSQLRFSCSPGATAASGG